MSEIYTVQVLLGLGNLSALWNTGGGHFRGFDCTQTYGNMFGTSVVLRPEEEEEEEKGPGFSCLHMHLIVVEFHHLRILLIHFRTLVTPILILSVALFIDLL